MFEIGHFEYKIKNSSKKIFCHQSIVIHNHEIVLIRGASGSGKSTFLQMLKGIIPQYTSGDFSGDIFYNGNKLSGEFFVQNLSEIIFLFQNPFSQLIYPNVAEEFFFSMENFHFTKEQMDQKKDELVKAFHLEPIWNKKTTELSHGECQRLVLASLLAINPKVLLLDEPTAFLDPAGREDFYRWLGIIKGSQTVIIVDHHLNEVLPFVDKILNVSAEGEVSIDGPDSVTLPIFNQDLARLIKPHQIKAISELKISGLSFHYPDQKKLLENVSLNLKSGEISVIKGKNGKGKSTLFKIIAGMIKPISGKVEIHKNNKLIVTKKNFLEIGFVFQNPESHFFYDTIAEEFKNVADKENLKYFLSLFFKNINLSSSPFLLSEGEKRRLSILMTVILNKTIILYDEPTFGQDEESILIIKEMILFLQKLGKIQIIISHDHSFINSLEAQVFDLQDEHLTREA